LTYPSEKYESQLGLFFPIYGKVKSVPNHQEIYPYHFIYKIYTLWLFNSLPWYRWPIEIDGLPFLKMMIFHGYVK